MNKVVVWVVLSILLITISGVFFITELGFREDSSGVTPSPTTSPGPVVKVSTHTSLGRYLTDNEGITLYVFVGDPVDGPIRSTCRENCARNWPPFLYDYGGQTEVREWQVDLITKKIHLFERNTGTLRDTYGDALQYAYNNKPLYYYVNDEKPGDIKGHGLDGWSVVFIED